MNLKQTVLLLMAVGTLGTTLIGCSSSNSSNGSSSSESSNQSTEQKEIYPTKATIKQTWKDSRSMEKNNSILEKNADDKYIRFSDIIDFNNPTKYTGSVQTILGTVVQVANYTSGEYGPGYKQLTVDAGDTDKSKIYLIDVKPSMPVRKDDEIATIVVIAGPAKYYNTDNKPVKAVYGVAPTDQFRNTGSND